MSINLMTAAWKIPGLNPGQKLVLLALCDNASDEGKCFPSIRTIATKCSMGDRTVQTHIRSFEDIGLVTRIERPGRSSVYIVNADALVAMAGASSAPAKSAPLDAPADFAPHPADFAPPPAKSAPAPADSAPITITKPVTEPSPDQSVRSPLAAKVKRKPGVPLNSPEVFEEAWAAYPKRAGSNSRADAAKAWDARVKAGADPAAMLEGVKRYAAFCCATRKVGTEYVKQAATFFGPSEHFLEAWTPPPGQRVIHPDAVQPVAAPRPVVESI